MRNMRNIDLVMYISFKHAEHVHDVVLMRPAAKIWNLRDFFQFFSVPKIENSRPDALAGLTN